MLTVSIYYEPGGGYTGTVVADGGELDGCAYRDIVGEERVSVSINEDVASLVGKGDTCGGFVGLLTHLGASLSLFEILEGGGGKGWCNGVMYTSPYLLVVKCRP